jgi:geranylgeranyl reductase family protein
MRPTDADVIIAGAGPAGSLAAFVLASKGVQVLILEKSQFPRYKTCGGGLTAKILREIPFDISQVIETDIDTIRFSRNCENVFSRTSHDPFMYCTMRGKLDDFLLQKAVKSGARVMMNQQIRRFSESEGCVNVVTDDSEFRSVLLVGADGASSIVARSAGLRKNLQMGLAWEAEVNVPPEFLARFSRTVFLDWGTFPGGYGWAFPKEDHFSVGVGGPAKNTGLMIPYYQMFLRYFSNAGTDRITREKQNNSVVPEVGIVSLKSWPIPVRRGKGDLHHSRILVAGDAAGLTDPLTGEGIYYAVQSGKFAAQSCLEFLSGSAASLEKYSERINGELMPELKEAVRISHLFNAFSAKIHTFVNSSDRAWNAFGKILLGDRKYIDVKKGFGRYRFLWNLACFLSKGFEKSKSGRFKKLIKKDPPEQWRV